MVQVSAVNAIPLAVGAGFLLAAVGVGGCRQGYGWVSCGSRFRGLTAFVAGTG